MSGPEPVGPGPARLRPADVLRTGAAGLRTRPLRALLSALGIAIGIASMLAVVGITVSSRLELDRTLAALGTNLLRVAPGEPIFSAEPPTLPVESVPMVGRIGPVTSVAATGFLPAARVYRTDRVPVARTGGIAVLAAHPDLRETVGARLADGSWFNAATGGYPTAVLGADAAHQLGILAPGTQAQVWLGDEWFTVIGILHPVPLAPELDFAALVGWSAAENYLGFDGHPTTVYCRTRPDRVVEVLRVLAATANPAAPSEVAVSRPSDALAAQQAADSTLTALLLGLGAVALLVGGVGVANTMVISVLERRAEIGLRRALGATRTHVCLQFLTESLLLSTLGGAGGLVGGVAATGGYALAQGWPVLVPPAAMAAAVGITVGVGALAGVYPAIRAARMPPASAIAAP